MSKRNNKPSAKAKKPTKHGRSFANKNHQGRPEAAGRHKNPNSNNDEKIIIPVLLQIDRNKKLLAQSLLRGRSKPQAFDNSHHKAAPGEIWLAEWREARGRHGGRCNLLKPIGKAHDADIFRKIAIAEHRLDDEFSPQALQDCASASVPELSHGRVDLQHIPFVTIDGADAKDFDDAVAAIADGNGWLIHVAIADVAWYVRPGSQLDREARQRGNSIYFPGYVIPMLPEKLSNDLCSLRPDVPRAALVASLKIDAGGELQSYQFQRGLICSRARLIYEDVQAAHDGDQTAIPTTIQTLLPPLYAAFRVLQMARQRRHTLELDLPERMVRLDERGQAHQVGWRQRLDSHRLIEEMMILANIAAARCLDGANIPAIYRIHAPPKADRLTALKDMLKMLGIDWPGEIHETPAALVRIQEMAIEKGIGPLVGMLLLRSQSQAIYHPENQGHFALALKDYAHFTSPIRRYADLVVHRGLLHHLGLAKHDSADDLHETAQHISQTERTAISAERSITDRYLADFIARNPKQHWPAHISGVTKHGLFLTLDEYGIDGLLPMHALPDDFYQFDANRQLLFGRRKGQKFSLGQALMVKLGDVNPLKGSVTWQLASPKAD